MTEYKNKLANELSPYLLQHSKNPVNWYPWNNEAFEKAKREDKPVFLSIGYSTCHWCHVMERESFEDEEVAKILNDGYVSIKVDREERPDIDSVYMTVCQMMTGSGGWPLTIIMTPEQKPFYSATYLPKYNGYGRLGLTELLQRITTLWQNNRTELIKASENVYKSLNIVSVASEKTETPSTLLLKDAYKHFLSEFDEENGGFGNAPKFPSPHNLLFLLKYSVLENERKASLMAETTLIQMYRGGIFDHIGGGFSRYSTDKYYLVPHFEKMLYDNALLIYAYAYAIERGSKKNKTLYENIITQTASYIINELGDINGGFYCAQDADSEGEEGRYYLFTPLEIEQIIGKAFAEDICLKYDITEKGHLNGKAIPNLLKNQNYRESGKAIEPFKNQLLKYRKERARLFKDDKVLTSWNALTIAALAKAGKILNREEYILYAKNAVTFIENHLKDKSGRLFIRWKDGRVAGNGQLDDYAFYAFSLIELYESTFDAGYLLRAVETADKMSDIFSDEKGGLFLYAEDAEQLINRPKEYYDGAIPSGNSVAAYVFQKIFLYTAEDKWRIRSNEQFSAITSVISSNPSAYCFGLLAMAELLYSSKELICTTPVNSIPEGISNLQKNTSISNLTIIIKNKENIDILEKIAPFTKNYPMTEKTTYYFCHNGSCEKPVTDEKELYELLDKNNN